MKEGEVVLISALAESVNEAVGLVCLAEFETLGQIAAGSHIQGAEGLLRRAEEEDGATLQKALQKAELVDDQSCDKSDDADDARHKGGDEERARSSPHHARNPECHQGGLGGEEPLFFVPDRDRQKLDETAGEVAKGCEEPELESAPEEVEAVGEVEGEGVRVLAPRELAAGGRERGEEAETEAAEGWSTRRAGFTKLTLFPFFCSDPLALSSVLFFLFDIFIIISMKTSRPLEQKGH